MTSSINKIEVVPVPVELKDYHLIVADIAELIYRAACDIEFTSASQTQNKKDTLLPPPMRTFLKEGENYAS